MFAFLNPDVVLFKVSTRKYSVDIDTYVSMHYSEDGKAVGLTAQTYPPREITSVTLGGPDVNLVRALGTYARLRKSGKSAGSSAVVAALKKEGCWDYVPDAWEQTTSDWIREKQYYYRRYTTEWKRLGWIEDTDMRKRP